MTFAEARRLWLELEVPGAPKDHLWAHMVIQCAPQPSPAAKIEHTTVATVDRLMCLKIVFRGTHQY